MRTEKKKFLNNAGSSQKKSLHRSSFFVIVITTFNADRDDFLATNTRRFCAARRA